jgi:hypothetical protein
MTANKWEDDREETHEEGVHKGGSGSKQGYCYRTCPAWVPDDLLPILGEWELDRER